MRAAGIAAASCSPACRCWRPARRRPWWPRDWAPCRSPSMWLCRPTIRRSRSPSPATAPGRGRRCSRPGSTTPCRQCPWPVPAPPTTSKIRRRSGGRGRLRPDGGAVCPDARAGGAVAFRHRRDGLARHRFAGRHRARPVSRQRQRRCRLRLLPSRRGRRWPRLELRLLGPSTNAISARRHRPRRRPSIGTAARSTSRSFSTTCSAAAWPARC